MMYIIYTSSVFQFQEHRVRILGDSEDPWFPVPDVSRYLGTKNIRQRLPSIKNEWKQIIELPDALNRIQRTTIINEFALLKLLFTSERPEAQVFTEWVCEVIVTIRKTGKYELQQRVQQQEEQLYTLQSTTRVVLDKDEEAKSISVWERAVHHGYLEADLVKIAYTPIEVTYQGMVTTMDHPNKKIFMNKKTNISKLLSNKMWSLHGKRPGFGKGRKNAYFEKDWVEYGDEILERYFEENPVEEWGLFL